MVAVSVPPKVPAVAPEDLDIVMVPEAERRLLNSSLSSTTG